MTPGPAWPRKNPIIVQSQSHVSIPALSPGDSHIPHYSQDHLHHPDHHLQRYQ